MIDLLISEIDGKIGPGDIVGAFINEAGINNEDIGKIDIDGDKAKVEVNEDVAKKIVDIMDENQIGGINVRVSPENDYQLYNKKVHNYANKFAGLVEMERKEEMERHELEMKRLSLSERENKGRAIQQLRGRDAGTAFGNKPMIKFMRQKRGEELPDTEISVGDLVMLSKNRPLADDNPTGTVAEKTRYSITVVFDNNPPSFLYKKGIRMDLYVNDITFQRMLDALGKIRRGSGRLEELREKLLGLDNLEWNEEIDGLDWVNQDLNESQKGAVRRALRAGDFYLIQGPPGTGKTMTAIEIINQAIKRKESVLATADSNIAVDNMVQRLAASGANVLRVGHPLRVTPVLREHTLDYKVMDNPDYKQAQELREKARELLNKQDDYTHPSGRWRRGMSNEQIRKKAQTNSSFRGVSSKKIQEMAEWLELQDKIDEFFEEIDELEAQAVNDMITGADVICTTNSTAGSEIMQGRHFDLLVVDEATQATEPGTLISLVRGDRAVLIGDHKQLPPTVLNEKAEKQGLSRSMFERMLDLHGKEFWSLLEVQYRMHEDIMGFSNREFYDGRLECAEQVRKHTLKDLGVVVKDDRCFTDKALNPEVPVVFLDTSSMEAEERSLAGSYSYDNPVEAEIVLDVLDEALKLGLQPEQIAIITPYKDQVDLLNHRCTVEDLEINTVDGFQGREKEVVITSFVRSNHQQNIGFLRDLRRLNVSLTRAKRKLIMVGDCNTISGHKVYFNLINYVKNEGLFYTL
ncbi:MAG: IGHMBP2 family helicase [Halanaerobiaceae bacterium]